MKEKRLPSELEGPSPAGASIRYLLDGPHGDMIHSTVPPAQIDRATLHATASEFWSWRRVEASFGAATERSRGGRAS